MNPRSPAAPPSPPQRHSDHDVTGTVRVSSVDAVRFAVEQLYERACPGAAFDTLWLAFHDFRRLYTGQLQGYVGCDTLYHDTQHSLDVTLAMARLLTGHELASAPGDRLGEVRVTLGLICALFHDAGYIRRTGEPARNGAEYTPCHITRGASLLAGLLPRLGLADKVPLATELLHFTGYERAAEDLELDDPQDSLVGHLLGTADMLAQMADRCYLEKCRDRLYAEFVLAGIAIAPQGEGDTAVRYGSGHDLLRQTIAFWESSARQRLDVGYNRAYRYVEVLYDGRNPYLEAIQRNLDHLRQVIAQEGWAALRRKPPCFTALPHPVATVGALVSRRLAALNAPAAALVND